MKSRLLLLLAPAAACLGAITNVRLVGTSATQVVIAYTAPDGNACTLQVSQSPTLTPLVPDVDPTIFAGANADLSRPSTVSDGLTRTVVIGQRTAQMATAGPYAGVRHYSRALQAMTQHYGLITCPSTGDTASFPVGFATTNIPAGQTYGEPWLNDGAGGQPWPETLGASTTESFVDPLTGLLLQRVSLRGNDYGYWPSMPFSTAHNQGQAPCASTGGWANPCNALLTGGNYATVGNSPAWLVLRNAMTLGNAWGGYTGAIGYTTCCQIDQLQLNLTGYVPGCSGATCQVDACLSLNDGASCAGAIQTVTFGTSSSTQTFGSANTAQFGATPWIFDTNPRFNMQESAPHYGQATVSGNQLTWVNGSAFSLYWITGGDSTIRLSPTSQANACAPPPASNDSTEYTVTSFVNGNVLTLSGSPPQGAVYWCAQPFAIMIRRHAADSNTAHIQGASMAALEDDMPTFASNGANSAGFDTQIGGGWFMNFGGLYWINPTTAEVRYYGLPYMPPGPAANPWNSTAWCPGNAANAGFWDNTQTMPTWYCSTFENSKLVVMRAQLTGGVPPAPASPYDGNGHSNFNSNCTASDSYTMTCPMGGGVNAVWTVLTPTSLNQDLTSQLAAFDPATSAELAKWTGVAARVDQMVEKGILYINFFSTGSMDSPTIILAFGPGDGVPAHAGQAGGPGLVGAFATYNAGPVITNPTTLPPQTMAYGRTLHGIAETGGTGWVTIGMNRWAPVNTTNSNIPAAASRATCASFGVAGNNNACVQLQINSYTYAGVTGYDPYLNGYNLLPPFTGAPGELRSAQIGDLACAQYSSSVQRNDVGCFYQQSEMFMLVAKGSNGLWTFQSNMYGAAQAMSGAPITLTWQSVETIIPPAGQMNFENAFWNPLTGCNGSPDPHANCMMQDSNDDGAHEYWRDGSATGAVNIPLWSVLGQWPFGYRSTPGAVPASISFPWAHDVPDAVPSVSMVAGNPLFAGAVGGAWPGEASSHPNPPGDLASAYEQARAFDYLTFGGNPFTFTAWNPTFTNVSGQLYSTSLSVTDPDDIGYFNRKLLSTSASCGDHPLTDVSGPNSAIDGTPTHSYQYCFPRANGECVSGSTVGQVYVNCPGLIAPYTCNGTGLIGATQLGVGNDVCLHNSSAVQQMVGQFTINQTDPLGAGRRNLVSDVGRIRMDGGFGNARLTPDNSGLLFSNWWSDLQSVSTWMAKMLPFPAEDSAAVNRGTFEPISVSLKPPADLGVNNAIVEFGYAEFGAPAALNCTTRNDPCVANQGTIPGGNAPYKFASESPTGMSCSSGCTITIPAIPQRVLYCRAIYRTSSNAVIDSTPYQVIVVP